MLFSNQCCVQLIIFCININNWQNFDMVVLLKSVCFIFTYFFFFIIKFPNKTKKNIYEFRIKMLNLVYKVKKNTHKIQFLIKS